MIKIPHTRNSLWNNSSDFGIILAIKLRYVFLTNLIYCSNSRWVFVLINTRTHMVQEWVNDDTSLLVNRLAQNGMQHRSNNNNNNNNRYGESDCGLMEQFLTRTGCFMRARQDTTSTIQHWRRTRARAFQDNGRSSTWTWRYPVAI